MANKVVISYDEGKFEYSDSFPHLPEVEFGLPFSVEVEGNLNVGLKLDQFKLMKFDGYSWSHFEDLTLTTEDPDEVTPTSIEFGPGGVQESGKFCLWRDGERGHALAHFKPKSNTPPGWFQSQDVKTKISKRNSEIASSDDKGPLQIWMTWTVTTAGGDTITFNDPWVPKPPQG